MLLAEHFIGKGLDLRVYDPEVHLSRLLGANRRFIEQHVPHIGSLMRKDMREVIDHADVLVVGLNGKDVAEGLREHARDDQVVVDLVRLPNRAAIRARIQGLSW